jgi:N-acetylglucosaminyldiphosphoundecaprenol N-acetyl-beta-D-mannosaminyltransferase
MKEEDVYYESYKEERDLILEYNQVDLTAIRMSNILGIGLDNINRTQAVAKIIHMIQNGGVNHVIPMNPYKLHRIKTNNDLRMVINKADMLLPSGAGLQWASKMLKNPLHETISILSFMMDIIRISEIKEYTIFFVGAKPEIVERAKLRIVGRHGGFFNQDREQSVIEAMRKSEANIIFVGLGFPKETKWIHSKKNQFKNTIFIEVGGSIDIISGEIKKAPAYCMERNLDWFYRIIARPWKIARLIRTGLFFLQVVWNRLTMR